MNITSDHQDVESKINQMQELTKPERAFLVSMDEKTKPMMLSMLRHMIVEPEMTYEDVVLMYEMLDEFDSKTVMAIVNQMTSEKATVANEVTKERTAEINRMRDELRVGI